MEKQTNKIIVNDKCNNKMNKQINSISKIVIKQKHMVYETTYHKYNEQAQNNDETTKVFCSNKFRDLSMQQLGCARIAL